MTREISPLVEMTKGVDDKRDFSYRLRTGISTQGENSPRPAQAPK
jgi:hypothetical protein